MKLKHYRIFRRSLPVYIIGLMLLLVILMTFLIPGKKYFIKSVDHTKWNDQIDEIEARSKEYISGPVIIFTGSSSIRFWRTLAEDMEPLPVVNHGFGGSMLVDAVYFAERVVTQFKPAIVVLYAGDNDVVWKDRFWQKDDTPQQCLNDFKSFVFEVHMTSPETIIYFISIKPAIEWKSHWPTMMRTNNLIEEYAITDKRIQFIDISTPMLNENGEPDERYFSKDGIHMNTKGYQLWTSIIKPKLKLDYNALFY